MHKIKALETRYGGCRFRSRLEARWAVFFDAINVKWMYEFEGYDLSCGWYLPDFYFPEWESYAEVKPYEFSCDELTKCFQLSIELGTSVWMLDGIPDHREYWCANGHCEYWGDSLVLNNFFGIDNNSRFCLSVPWKASEGTREDMRGYFRQLWEKPLRSSLKAIEAARSARFGT